METDSAVEGKHFGRLFWSCSGFQERPADQPDAGCLLKRGLASGGAMVCCVIGGMGDTGSLL